MTSSNGNIFRVTGPLCEQRPVTRSFDVFFDLRLNKRSSKHRDGGDLRRHRVHYDVTVMFMTWRCAQSQGAPYCLRLAWFRAVISPEHQHCSTGDITVLCKAVSIDTADWDRYKMATISQKPFSNAFFWMTIYEFRLTLNVRGPSYLDLTWSISLLLMPWRLTSPGHQQPWYWLCKICIGTGLTRGRI